MFSIYVHIPFCDKKCNYCNFVSFVQSDSAKDQYLNCLMKEFTQKRFLLPSQAIQSVFIGGGTPSCLSVLQLNRLLSMIQTFLQDHKLASDFEFTIEANPASLSKEKLMLLKEYGVNRISMGVQSIHTKELNALGRIHRYQDVKKNIYMLKDNEFDNINLDIMFGIPYQTYSTMQNTIEELSLLFPKHISFYGLQLEESTPLFEKVQKNKLRVSDDQQSSNMYHLGIKTLEELGYYQYEISNFSQQGYESKHNLQYWKNRPYIGFGVNAHSFINGIRFFNASQLPDYYRQDFLLSFADYTGASILTIVEELEEWIMLRLRLVEGIHFIDFQKKFNVNFYETYQTVIQNLLHKKWIELHRHSIHLTTEGFLFSNQAILAFLMKDPPF